MVESISDEKADDPHGSESHLSEVAHEGEDAAFGETTHDSVSTESAKTELHSNGPDFVVDKVGDEHDDPDDELIMIDRHGDVAIGPDDMNDPTDLGEMLTSAAFNTIADDVNTQTIEFAAKQFYFRTHADISTSQHYYGQGRNRTRFKPHEDMEDDELFNLRGSGNIVRFQHFKFDEGPNSTRTKTHVKNDDGLNELQFLNCEFRSVDEYGIEWTGTRGDGGGNFTWNMIFDCWFLDGAGFTINNCRDLRFIGNRISDSAGEMEFNTVEDLVVSGNDFEDNNFPEFNDVQFHGQSPWWKIYHKDFDTGTPNVTVDLPDFIDSRAGGAVRVTVQSRNNTNGAPDVLVRPDGHSDSSDYEGLMIDYDNGSIEQMSADGFQIIERQRRASAYCVITVPRIAPVVADAGGANSDKTNSNLFRANMTTSSNMDELDVVFTEEVDDAEIIVEVCPDHIVA